MKKCSKSGHSSLASAKASAIEVNNLTALSINEKFLRKVTQRVFRGEGKKEVGLSIALIGPGKMRKLNRKYRGKNRVTDVLAFSQSKSKFIIPPGKEKLGEIIICLREVKKNAKKFGQSFKKELALCLIHGILHLLGYNHESSKEKAKKMEKKQNYYLEKCQELIS